MPHPDADDLALLALGESMGSAVDAHVAGCDVCSAEIESFRQTVDLADLSNYGENAPRPGEHVWQAIAAELGFTGSQQPAGAVITAVPESGSATGPRAAAGTHPETATDAGPADTGSTRPAADPQESSRENGSAPHLRALPSANPNPPPVGPTAAQTSGPPARRWSRWAAPLAAAVVGIAVGAGAVVVAQNRTDDVTIEATAPLTPVDDGPLSADGTEQLGKAELVAAPTGQEVRVNAADLPPTTNSYEVWLFGDEGRMISLGTLNDGSGSFVVPQGINTQEYRVVDVSDEPPDGNPQHSGVSLIRGAFS